MHMAIYIYIYALYPVKSARYLTELTTSRRCRTTTCPSRAPYAPCCVPCPSRSARPGGSRGVTGASGMEKSGDFHGKHLENIWKTDKTSGKHMENIWKTRIFHGISGNFTGILMDFT